MKGALGIECRKEWDDTFPQLLARKAICSLSPITYQNVKCYYNECECLIIILV